MAQPEPPQALQPIPADQDLPTLCATEIIREGKCLWREHRKQELITSAIAAPISAFLVAAIVAIVGGSGISWSAVLAGVAAALLSIPLVLLGLYGYYRLYEAPRSLYQKSREQIVSVNSELTQRRGIVGRYASDLSNANVAKERALERAYQLEQRLTHAETEKSGLQAHLAKLSERLLPKFQILFESEPPFVEELSWNADSKRRRVYIRIKVVNDSAKTIENTSIFIESFTAFDSQMFQNIPLRMMNNDSVPPRKFFSLHPDVGQFMDLAYKDSALDEFSIFHAYEGKRRIGTEEKDVTICVVATGLNAVPAKRRFRLHVDSEGILHCEPLDRVESISLPSAPLG